MPIQMGLAALLMSGAMHSGEPATKLTLGADAVSQPNGEARIVLAQFQTDTCTNGNRKVKRKNGKSPPPVPLNCKPPPAGR
jgi:hypothetical protein